MQEAIGVLGEVVKQSAANQLDRENLLDHIRQVLGGFLQLRGTTYDDAVNNFLVRVCATELSLVLSDGDLAELWK